MRLALFSILVVVHAAHAQSIARWQGDRCTAQIGARASLTPDGPWLATPLAKAAELDVYDRTSKRPQIVEWVNGLRIVLYIDPLALQTFTLGGAVLSPHESSKRTPMDPGARLPAGLPVTMLERADGLSKVHIDWNWEEGPIDIEGYIAHDALGPIWKSVVDRDEPSFEPTITIPGTHELLDAPRGKAFARSAGRERVDAMKLRAANQHTLVRTARGIVGWIPSSVVQARRSRGGVDGVDGGEEGGVEGGVVGGVASAPAVLPEGAIIYDAIGGRAIGEVGWGFTQTPLERKRGWQRHTATTRFGTIDVWARTPTRAELESREELPPRPKNQPQVVSPTALEKLRSGGTPEVVPDDDTRARIAAAGKERVIHVVKLCIDATGAVASTTIIKSSGFPAYDKKIGSTIRKTWRYRPFEVDGTAVPVCTAMSFIYKTS